MPTQSRWHPSPTAADADNGEDWEVAPEVMKVSEVMSWKERAVVERMYASPFAELVRLSRTSIADEMRDEHWPRECWGTTSGTRVQE